MKIKAGSPSNWGSLESKPERVLTEKLSTPVLWKVTDLLLFAAVMICISKPVGEY